MPKPVPGIGGRESPVDGCPSLISFGLQGWTISRLSDPSSSMRRLTNSRVAEDAELQSLAMLSQLPCLGVYVKLSAVGSPVWPHPLAQPHGLVPGRRLYGCSGCPAPLGPSPLQGKQYPPASASDGRSLPWCDARSLGHMPPGPPTAHKSLNKFRVPLRWYSASNRFPTSRLGRDGLPLLRFHQLLGGLDETGYGPLGVIGFRVEVQHVLHCRLPVQDSGAPPQGCSQYSFFRSKINL